jgi:hypothetical protein
MAGPARYASTSGCCGRRHPHPDVRVLNGGHRGWRSTRRAPAPARATVCAPPGRLRTGAPPRQSRGTAHSRSQLLRSPPRGVRATSSVRAMLRRGRHLETAPTSRDGAHGRATRPPAHWRDDCAPAPHRSSPAAPHTLAAALLRSPPRGGRATSSVRAMLRWRPRHGMAHTRRATRPSAHWRDNRAPAPHRSGPEAPQTLAASAAAAPSAPGQARHVECARHVEAWAPPRDGAHVTGWRARPARATVCALSGRLRIGAPPQQSRGTADARSGPLRSPPRGGRATSSVRAMSRRGLHLETAPTSRDGAHGRAARPSAHRRDDCAPAPHRSSPEAPQTLAASAAAAPSTPPRRDLPRAPGTRTVDIRPPQRALPTPSPAPVPTPAPAPEVTIR